jgi:SRSO17 transposase
LFLTVSFHSSRSGVSIHAIVSMLAAMAFEMNGPAVERLRRFFCDDIGGHLDRPEQRASFATYAFGLLSDGERKSVEPMASRATGDARACQQMHDRLLHFVGDSPWDDHAVRREAARYVTTALGTRERVAVWIIDDTGFPKQGVHSVGVQRQYTGTLGKIANCQIGVSLVLATSTEQVPVDFALYLPKSWTDDPKRCVEAGIPEDVVFKTKPDLALGLIARALDDKLPGEIVLADPAYGESSDFRAAIRVFGLDYAVGIRGLTKVWLLDSNNRHHHPPMAAADVATKLGPKAFRRYTWRDGTHPTRGKLAGRFCFRRVKIAHDDGTEVGEREPVWLVIEWPEGESKPTKFVLATLPRRMSKKNIVRTIKERWRTERAYQEMKGELGLDHFEGRSFRGWHHHVSVVLCCYAFVVAERVRHFPPSARRASAARSITRAA